MGRFRRKFRKGEAYFVTCRTAEGLPFVPNAYISNILLGLVARAQHLYPHVSVCHFIFMSNHYHFIVTLDGDATEMKRFFGYLNGEIASCINRLQGVAHRKFWAKRYDAKPILTPEDVIEKTAYIYLNPVKAGLVKKVDQWEGASSLNLMCSDVPHQFKWISSSCLVKLPNKKFSSSLLKKCLEHIAETPREKFPLKLKSSSWKFCFSESQHWSDQEVSSKIELIVEQGEQRYAKINSKTGKAVVGMKNLQKMSIYKKYISKTYGRNTLCICHCRILVEKYKQLYRDFCAQCRAAWDSMIRGDSAVAYPPDAFVPTQNPAIHSFTE